MTIEKMHKIAKILLILSFFIPLIGIFTDIYNVYFAYSAVPVFTGTSILMAIYNAPLFLLAMVLYVTGTILEARRKINLATIFYLVSGTVSVGSILFIAVAAFNIL